MSKYTTELRYICESVANLTESQGGNNVENILESCWNKIFDFDFPIFDEDYRKVLCKKILKHYYFREIGFETYGIWKLKLNTKLNEIMPYYNKMYESTLLDFNPIEDINITTHHTLSKTGSENGSVNDSTSKTGQSSSTITKGVTDNTTNSETINNTKGGTDYDLHSNTPQGSLSGLDNNTYLTSADKHTKNDTDNTTKSGTVNNTVSESSSIGTNDSNTTTGHKTTQLSTTNSDNFNETISGKSSGKSYSKLIQEYRAILVNIDVMIINELYDLFFQLW